MNSRPLTVDEEADRLIALLDVGIDAAKVGELDIAELVAREALESAKRLPKKSEAICLPDHSGERL